MSFPHCCRLAPGLHWLGLAAWDRPIISDPDCYDSPEMFRHEDDICLVALQDVGGPFDRRRVLDRVAPLIGA